MNVRIRFAAAFVAGALMAAPAVVAQAPAAPQAAPAPTVDQIVARYLKARGGLEKLHALQSLRQEGRVNAGAGRIGLVSREMKRPGKVRFEFTVQGVTSVVASDGQRGWKVEPQTGDVGVKPLPNEALVEAREQADIDGPLVDWKAKGSRIELAGTEAVNGSEAWKLKLSLKSGGVLLAWVDTKSANLVRTEATRQVRGRPVRIVTTFGDFRTTSGIVFPHAVEVRAEGRPQLLKITVDRVDVNPELADTRFTPPS